MSTRDIPLGSGVLTWASKERRSDRYGCVYLIDEGRNSLSAGTSRSRVADNAAALIGLFGKLVVVVTAARKSTHIGDLFRDLYPRTPAVGQRIELGQGQLFVECHPEGGYAVGVVPAVMRIKDWLDPRALYDVHEQSVRLIFEVAAS